jgi:hypothetical protein
VLPWIGVMQPPLDRHLRQIFRHRH